jgi:hypothetical protein
MPTMTTPPRDDPGGGIFIFNPLKGQGSSQKVKLSVSHGEKTNNKFGTEVRTGHFGCIGVPPERLSVNLDASQVLSVESSTRMCSAKPTMAVPFADLSPLMQYFYSMKTDLEWLMLAFMKQNHVKETVKLGQPPFTLPVGSHKLAVLTMPPDAALTTKLEEHHSLISMKTDLVLMKQAILAFMQEQSHVKETVQLGQPLFALPVGSHKLAILTKSPDAPLKMSEEFPIYPVKTALEPLHTAGILASMEQQHAQIPVQENNNPQIAHFSPHLPALSSHKLDLSTEFPTPATLYYLLGLLLLTKRWIHPFPSSNKIPTFSPEVRPQAAPQRDASTHRPP